MKTVGRFLTSKIPNMKKSYSSKTIYTDSILKNLKELGTGISFAEQSPRSDKQILIPKNKAFRHFELEWVYLIVFCLIVTLPRTIVNAQSPNKAPESLLQREPRTPTPLSTPSSTPSSTPTPPKQNTKTKVSNNIIQECRIGGGKNSEGRLLFTLVYQNHRNIYGSDLKSKKVFPLIAESGDNYAPSISPDGIRFAFISNRTGTPQVFVSSWDGTTVQQLTTSNLKKGYPSWSKDGTNIYFSAESGSSDNNESTSGNIYSVKSTGGSETQITRYEGRNIAPSIQPDGRSLVYSTNRFWPGWDICVFDITQKTESCILAGSHSFIKPRLSHDGQLLAFVQTQASSSQVGVLRFGKGSEGNEYFTSGEHETDPTWGNGDNEIYTSSGLSAEDPHKILVRDLKTKQSEPLIVCPYSLKEPSWNAITQTELSEKKIIGEFKVLKAIIPSVGTPVGYTPPYVKKR